MNKILLLASLFIGMISFSGCSVNNEQITSKSLTYNYMLESDGICIGGWSNMHLDEKILAAIDQNGKRNYFVAGDILDLKIQGNFKDDTCCSFPKLLELEEDARIVDININPATIIKIETNDIQIVDDDTLIINGYANTVENHIITSLDGDYIDFKDNEHEYLYLSTQEVDFQCDGKAILAYCLYTFNPDEINNPNQQLFSCHAFNKKIATNEHKKIEVKQYECGMLSFSSYSTSQVFLPENFIFDYDKDAFDIVNMYKNNVDDVVFSIVCKKIGRYPITIKVHDYIWILNIDVAENDMHFDNVDDLANYSEFLNILNDFKYHDVGDTSITSDEFRFTFDTYNTDYVSYLNDSCYYPNYFPDAPKSNIMNREITIENDENSIHHLNIIVSEIDPGCTNPLDRVKCANYDMVKISDAYKIDTFNLDLYTLINYEFVSPYIYEVDGLKFNILKQKDDLYAFFDDGTYLYSIMVQYDMGRV